MKLSGMILLFACCAGIGSYSALQVKYQVRIYQKLLLLLQDCMTYIRYQRMTVYEIFSVLAERPDYRNLDLIQHLQKNDFYASSPEQLWNHALQESRLPDEAKQILQNLGSELGKSDMQSQLAVLMLCQSQVQKALVSCEAGSEKKSRLYQSLGWLGGAMLAVLFL
ncbi:MAG: stage III sporulation protein AB [Oscillospiraceae bacterium]|nr:stage III sporulation protein AB [Oscillospiraceae bacterium]